MKKSIDINKGFVLWIMGPTSSGKTTIASKLVEEMNKAKQVILHYDGDEIRDRFSSQSGFSEKDRLAVVNNLIHFSNKASNQGINVVVSALTANEDAREKIEKDISNLIKVYLDCGINICIERDPKGLYEKAIKGEIDTLIGYNTPYVTPNNVELVLNSENLSPVECVEEIMKYIEVNNLITVLG